MLGITDTASASRYSEVTVALKNAAGTFVDAGRGRHGRGSAAMKPGSAGPAAPNVASTDPKAYPLTS